MKIIGIIPARMGSSRFPGKPIAPLLGRPMIEHVYRRSAMCGLLESVYVATCDEDIRKCVLGFGGKALMTLPTHQRASDRVAEAARGLMADVVVMIQGDEPMVHPEMIGQSVRPFFTDPAVPCVNLISRIKKKTEYQDMNTVKVVMDRRHNALYFSREHIPSSRQGPFRNLQVYKQVCIIPFRYDCLMRYAQLGPTPLEAAESVDMLRLLENGVQVHLVETAYSTYAVDTPADLRRVESRMRNDPLLRRYSRPGKISKKR